MEQKKVKNNENHEISVNYTLVQSEKGDAVCPAFELTEREGYKSNFDRSLSVATSTDRTIG